ncbi:ArsR/SmtB family transcription factor, partial [Thiomonas sp.]|uniref:ArsR/SmtB family transcription factor n=1 Tax=Thiomonas sp. TaxID=2047785 RepID=UPI00345CE0AF
FHLAHLSRVGLARRRQEGRFVIYAADFPVMNELLGFLTANCCGGNPCMPGAGAAALGAAPADCACEAPAQGQAR